MLDQKIDYLQLGCHYVPCHPKHIKCLDQNCQRLAFLNAPVEAPQETSAFALAGFVGGELGENGKGVEDIENHMCVSKNSGAPK